MTGRETFVDRMKRCTRMSHNLSDKLVNVKLALSLNSDDVWAEGLLVFYEIFKFIENYVAETENENLRRLIFDGLARTAAIEEDIRYYMGSNWVVSYQIRDAVADYLDHLQHLVDTDSDLLIPYIYQLYMELLSTGQLVKTKKELEFLFVQQDGPPGGDAAITFDNPKVSELRERLTNEINAIVQTMDEEKRDRLIEEAYKVSQLNMSVLKTMGSMNRVLYQRFILCAFCVAGVFAVYCLLSY